MLNTFIFLAVMSILSPARSVACEARLAPSPQVRDERSIRVEELMEFTNVVRSIISQRRTHDLGSLLEPIVTVGVDYELPRALVQEQLNSSSELLYCRLFDSKCIRRTVEGHENELAEMSGHPALNELDRLRSFRSVLEIFEVEFDALEIEIRFWRVHPSGRVDFDPSGAEDLDSADILFHWGKDPISYGWLMPPMLTVVRVSGVWKILTLFPPLL